MATTTQPEIPWNVAGIAPEAREAARTSARREGLSVGEWLTRRILRGLAEPGAATEEWWFAENGRTPSNENPVRNGHQRGNAGLRSVIEHPGESGHHNKNRSASGDMAAEIKLPARKVSENTEPLDERIVRLDARIARAEIRAAAEEAKHAETVKALQARVAVLTEQISKTATRSATQDTHLAKAIEAVTERFLQTQGESAEQQSAVTARIETIAEDNGTMNARIAALAEDTASLGEKFTESRDEGERQLRDVEDRIAATESAVEAVRRDSSALDRLGGSVDHLTQRVEASEVAIDAAKRDSGELDRVGGLLDQLTRRFETSETEYLNNVERFEGRLTRIEANSGDATIDRRLQGIEQALADMAKLIEKNTPEKPAAIDPSEQSARPDRKPEFAQLRDGSPREPVFGTSAAAPILDLPPFPEKPKNSSAPPPEQSAAASDLRAPSPQPGETARTGNSSEVRNAPFSWVDSASQKQPEAKHARLILLGALGLLVLVAVGMGFYLSTTQGRGIVGTSAKPVRYAVTANAPKAVQPPLQPRATQLSTAPASPSTERRPEPQAVAIQKAKAALPAKQVAPLQRLAALAHAGHAKAQEVLGLAYLDGDGVPVNEAEGARWLLRAATGGEAVAAYRLGTLYERGHGVAANAAKAAQWYAVAAKAGNRKAMHNLAVAFAQGSGVRKDPSLAAQWFSRAASLGLADSEFNLGVLYERGMGVPQSLPEAYKWYAIAAAQGDSESKSRVDVIAAQLRPADKAAADKSAARFHPKPFDPAANTPPIAASLVGGA